MALNPVKMTEEVLERYQDYFLTTFHLSDPELFGLFQKALQTEGALVKGPFIERLARFQTGVSVNDLIREGILSPLFRQIDSNALPIDRLLYCHQEQAIRKTVTFGRNIIISAGTGSGKTEAFLIPILNYLFRQKEKGSLGPGVRSLLLYPMNALANDQVIRLRKILRNIPFISFGIYTGETEKSEGEALTRYRELGASVAPFPNELLSREKMKESPPNILITNYAMLEYLLLRPQDHVFFEGKFAAFWRSLVLDEIHTYSGAKAIETALLLRRLVQRISPGVEAHHLQFFGTSASLGNSIEASQKLANFGSTLFGAKVEWEVGNSEHQDIILGEKKRYEPRISLKEAEMYTLVPSSLYPELLSYYEQTEPISKEISKWINEQRESLSLPEKLKAILPDGNNSEFGFREKLILFIECDSIVLQANKILEIGPIEASQLASALFPDRTDKEIRLTNLINLINRVCFLFPSTSLSSMKYHLFLRALEGAFVSFYPSKELSLERKEREKKSPNTMAKDMENSVERTYFEIGACRNCGSCFLVGKIDKHSEVLSQSEFNNESESESIDWFLILNSGDRIVADEDEEDEESSLEEDPRSDVYKLCSSCGKITPETRMGEICNCKAGYIRVQKAKSNDGNVNICPSCGTRSSISPVLWRFLDGSDASSSVMATSLLQNIFGNLTPAEREKQSGFLVFSDSRQSAAYFAPYLQESYDSIFWRRILVQTLEKYREKALENDWNVKNLADFAKKVIPEDLLIDKQAKETKTFLWVQYETIGFDRRNGLEGTGLLGFQIGFSHSIQKGLRELSFLLGTPWHLQPEEILGLYQVLLSSFRKKGAITFLPDISPEDEFFAPRNQKHLFSCNAHNTGGMLSWIPLRYANSRSDYLLRLFPHVSTEDIEHLLAKIWDEFDDALWKDYFEPGKSKKGQFGKQLRIEHIYIRSPLIDPDLKLYQCDRCKELSLFSVKGVCSSYLCCGKLKTVSTKGNQPKHSAFSINHYRDLYLTLDTIPLRVEEHTAQLKYGKAREFQEAFYQKKIQILSCSTTFELGVDVGDLEVVFMRNVPPTPSNYLQRSGRAGRKTGNSAFILTYALRRPHDRYFFNSPDKMIRGEIHPPSFVLENEKIRYRHILAIALSQFWYQRCEYFGTVDAFFFSEPIGVKQFEEFLKKKPDELLLAIQKAIPAPKMDPLDVSKWKWVEYLFSENSRIHASLRCIYEEILKDIETLEELQKDSVSEKKFSNADRFEKKIKTIKSRQLVQFLAQKGILPRYGFPVDVIEMKLPFDDPASQEIELSRDLRIALSEYAPENPVYADKRKWSTRFIVKMPGKELIEQSFAFCNRCGFSKIELQERDKIGSSCPICSGRLKKGSYVIPEFGFLSGKSEKAGLVRKKARSSTRVFFAKEIVNIEERNIDLSISVHLKALLGNLVTINDGKGKFFRICSSCGYATLSDSVPKKHSDPRGRECKGIFRDRKALGFEFKTDILELSFPLFPVQSEKEGYWLSVLYALLQGISLSLDIDRNDIDGCLYPVSGENNPRLILFDDIPGGAGHVRRCIEEKRFEEILCQTEIFLNTCQCGGEPAASSCYGCLRNYSNQRFHGILKRGYALDWLKKVFGDDYHG